ncbi:MAG: hypothetical protein IPI35_17720 [Deltaproteobacteria bacterium]|nr:hypothetical protein [Deltaproteobacteria bacterium]
MQGWEEPRRRKRRRDKARPLVEVPEARDRRPAGEFGRAAQLGDNSEIATKKGYRAAVIPLRKGLFLVAELPVEATKSEFGVVPLLGPLMVKAAVKALTGSGEERREARRDDPDRPRLWSVCGPSFGRRAMRRPSWTRPRRCSAGARATTSAARSVAAAAAGGVHERRTEPELGAAPRAMVPGVEGPRQARSTGAPRGDSA